ncbi:hypothetical protein KFE25_012078 [Diacronema lutheri]|uniref:RNA helicase n=1 Tax=Diacronema lutheri TaxID=2081491 RepID=A0A8J5X9B0_DIALT|nr:hypothetical protein KFE25_012078 [Diacronema lutheri]
MAARREASRAFLDLGLHDWLARSCAQLGMREPMPIQRAAIPAILSGRDVIGRASTGSGKTAAFALPILQRLSEEPFGVFALVLTPTRELAVQISEQVRALGELMRVRCEVVVGGADMIAQAAALGRRPHVVIGTPGRLLDHLRSGQAEAAALFVRLRVLVLDEADRLLDLGFGAEIAQLLERLPPSDRRQTLLFSATITASLRELQAIALDTPLVVDARRDARATGTDGAARSAGGDAAGDGVDGEPEGEEGAVVLPTGLSQYHLFVPLKVKDAYLVHALRLLADARGTVEGRGYIVFTSTCASCELLTRMLLELGVQATSLHSLQPQRARIAALQRFRSHLVDVLVATDIAARGLDVPAVCAVINYNVPAMPADYVHRVGRTARAGRRGLAITLVSQYEVDRFLAIERVVGATVPSLDADAPADGGADGGAARAPPAALSVRESAVLRCLPEVSGARRAAMLQLTENGFLGKAQQRRAKRRAEREGAIARAAGAPETGGDGGGAAAAPRTRDRAHALAAKAPPLHEPRARARDRRGDTARPPLRAAVAPEPGAGERTAKRKAPSGGGSSQARRTYGANGVHRNAASAAPTAQAKRAKSAR